MFTHSQPSPLHPCRELTRRCSSSRLVGFLGGGEWVCSGEGV